MFAIMTTSLAFGLSLDDAKRQGLVGEQPDGYLGIVGSSSPDLLGLVTMINRERHTVYQEIAARNKTSLQTVELLAGKTAIEKTEAGRYIKLPSGKWMKK